MFRPSFTPLTFSPAWSWLHRTPRSGGMGDEEAPELTLEQKLEQIVVKYAVLLEPHQEDRTMAVADLEALGPKFTAELAKLQAKQTGALNVGEEASDLQMKMCVSRDFHMQRISEADAKISRLLQARTKEDLAERKAAEPPPEDE
mgnify:CR=1 FL=1